MHLSFVAKNKRNLKTILNLERFNRNKNQKKVHK